MNNTQIDDKQQAACLEGSGNPRESGPTRAGHLKLALMAAVVVAVFAIALQAVTRFAEVGYGHHQVVRILVQGQTISVPEKELGELGASLRGYLDERHAQVLADIEGMIDAQVDALFAPAFERVPDYVNWYYSLGASGMRFGTLIFSDLDEHIERSVKQRLLGGDRLDNGLQQLIGELDQTLLTGQESLKPYIEARLLRRYGNDRHPEERASESPIAQSYDLSSALTSSLAATEEDYSRWQKTSGTATFAAGAAVAGRVVASSAILRAAVAQAGRSLAGMAARRAATAAPAAAGAGAAAAPTGPGAIAVGAGVFVVGFVGGEYVFLQVDRHTRGGAFEQELETSIQLARDDLKGELHSHYREVLYQAHAHWLRGLDHTFGRDDVAREFRVLGGVD